MIDYAQTHPDAIYLSEDEASMYLQATTTSVWAPVGQTPVVKASPERDKVSFYGTLNLVSGQEIVTQAETMNSEATAIHLKQILAAYPAKQILLFWDRATWHGGAAVRQVLAENPRLELMKYPAGSPDLNPQEHVWKAARTHVSHNHDQPKLAELADRFERFLKTNKFNYSFLEKFSIETIRAMSK
ncbi:MAG: IS630 family transposase [Ardenticatenaceae bacterium]|nr:IS630 family transposase [Ardenticatenaceae bacterium]MCB8980085.1 IS630 family transposase [Ardenticatenaceae bacterium]MCB8980364.1 IS630 family transposase [Ardenticatenaceae bacterium]